jgi:ferrochelatase
MKAVLMMAHGTPERLDQMEEYLTLVRGGRPPSPELVEEMTHNYSAIGGQSPLTERTISQGRALESALGRSFRVFVGMRNWHPFIHDVVRGAIAEGAQEVIALPMAPQFSSSSVGKYWDAIRKAVPPDLPLVLVPSWFDHIGLIEAFSEKVTESVKNNGPFDQFLFTAHSLPERVKEIGDPPYPTQVRRTAEGVVSRLELRDWQLVYQSAGRTPEPWIGPDLVDKLSELAIKGCRRILVVPVGFVCDHTEILYDIDIQAKQAAKELGIDLHRSESLNSSPKFILALADIIRNSLEP